MPPSRLNLIENLCVFVQERWVTKIFGGIMKKVILMGSLMAILAACDMNTLPRAMTAIA